MDLWQYEREALADGHTCVCGCDEAGAGPLAGPVYAAAVDLPFETEIPGLNDSKKLTEKRREALFPVIQAAALSWAVAEGLLQGFEDDSLQPGGTATRAQIATILMRFLAAVSAE